MTSAEHGEATLLSTQLLQRLEDCWRCQGAPVLERLRPGLADQDMDSLTASLGVTLNGEARTWWGWHDGAQRGRKALERSLVSAGWSHLSLEEAVSETLEFRQFAEEAAGSRCGMIWNWIVLGTDHGGGALCFDCGVQGAASPTVMRNVDEGVSTARRVETFGQVVEWWIEGMDAGYLVFDRSTGYWRADWRKIPAERAATGMV